MVDKNKKQEKSKAIDHGTHRIHGKRQKNIDWCFGLLPCGQCVPW